MHLLRNVYAHSTRRVETREAADASRSPSAPRRWRRSVLVAVVSVPVLGAAGILSANAAVSSRAPHVAARLAPLAASSAGTFFDFEGSQQGWSAEYGPATV